MNVADSNSLGAPHPDGAAIRKPEPASWRALIAGVAQIAIPTAVGNAFEYLPVCFALIMVGHLPDGRAGLDAMALGRAWFNLTALAPGFGLLAGLRTLCPQAVGGGRPQLCRFYAQRALAVVWVGALPCALAQWGCAPTLRLLGHDPALAAGAQAFAVRLLPQYFGVTGMTALQRVYQAHDMVHSNMAITGAVCAAAPLIQWFFIHRLGLGHLGAAWAAGCFNALYLCLQVPHLWSVGMGYLFAPAWGDALFGEEGRRGLREYWALTQWGFLQTCLEWWVLECVVLAVARLDDSEVLGVIAASAVAGNTQALFVMAWIGLLVAGASLVGRAVGAGDEAHARAAAACTVATAGACGAGIGLALLCGRGRVAGLFTPNDASVTAASAALLAVLGGLVVPADALNNALGGCLCGLGFQREAARSQLFGYYGVGMPLAAWAAFGPRSLCGGAGQGGVHGAAQVWAGVGVSMLASSGLQLRVLLEADWGKAIKQAKSRTEPEKRVPSRRSNEAGLVYELVEVGDGEEAGDFEAQLRTCA